MNRTRGSFITFEGGEGVGKSTNLQFVATWLRDRGVKVLCSREPGGTPLAEEIRHVLLAPRDERVDPLAELLLVFAARAQHLNTVILPALEQGCWVLCDRFTDATYAYQGYARGISLEAIAQLECLVQAELRPDKVFLLDADSSIGLHRAKSRGSLDRFEREDVEFYQSVRDGYLHRAAKDRQRYIVVDAARPLEQVQNDIARELEKLALTEANRL